MSRFINIADTRGRNAQILYSGVSPKSDIRFVTPTGEETKTIRLLKSPVRRSYSSLMMKFGSSEALAEALISGDPEIDMVETGRYIQATSRLYVNKELKPVYKIVRTEQVYAPDGTLKEERTPRDLLQNILAELPVKPAGRLFPRKAMYNKLVFAKKYQLSHVNGLTFDFLFEIARELHEKDSLMMVGGGAKGADPLVFQDGGKGYRAFLEGRIQDNKYILLLHLSNLELKPI